MTYLKKPEIHRCQLPNAWHATWGAVWRCDECRTIYVFKRTFGPPGLWEKASKRWLRKHDIDVFVPDASRSYPIA